MKEKASILVVDDEESIRVSLNSLLEKENYKSETANSASMALEKLDKSSYDLILTDIMMDEKTGMELLKTVKNDYSSTAVLLMTGYASLETAIEAVRLGALDYLVKPIPKETLLFNISRCLEINRKNKTQSQTNGHTENFLKVLPESNNLTQKELIVYKHLIAGMPNKSIAEKLNVTLPTVKFHLKNIYKKFGINGRAGILKIISQSKV
tara:strand:- start:716 stop:1342 length:627 start_codon:yes stop_codon:yes gene_type:complete